jgi:hypothetical protein
VHWLELQDFDALCCTMRKSALQNYQDKSVLQSKLRVRGRRLIEFANNIPAGWIARKDGSSAFSPRPGKGPMSPLASLSPRGRTPRGAVLSDDAATDDGIESGRISLELPAPDDRGTFNGCTSMTRDVMLQERLHTPEQQLVVGSRLLHADGITEGVVALVDESNGGDEAAWQVLNQSLVSPMPTPSTVVAWTSD